jgi:hypothetical protein
MKDSISNVLICATCLLLLGTTNTWAASSADEEPTVAAARNGGLLVFPKRVVFSGRERSAVLTLMNSGAKPTTFRLELIDLRMDEEGRLMPYRENEGAPGRTLKGMVRFSPRQVTVEAGDQQTVRVFVRKPADLEPGEYRSHLLLRALPSTDQGPRIEDFQAEQENALSIRITALPAISLPVIVRHGDLDASVSLQVVDVLERGPGSQVLSLRLDRQGDRSVYGDMAAYWLPALGGDEILVGRANGVAIYTTVQQRTFDLPLRLPEDLRWDAGVLRVAFESRPELDGGGAGLSADYEVALP